MDEQSFATSTTAPRRSRRRQQIQHRQPHTTANQPISTRRRQGTNQGDTSPDPMSASRQHEAADARNARSNDMAEDVAEDDLCPICQLLLHRPVTTSCNHTLCELCMATWADVSVASQMQIVDIDEPPVAFDAVSGLEAKCPMCRTQTSATLNNVKVHELRTKYPQTYAEREAEETSNTTTGDEGEIQTLTLSIGNRHQLTNSRGESGNIHDWTFFVRPSRTDIIEEVHILLHPTFRPPRIIHQRPPYEIRRLGWGYFTIVAYIMLKPGYSWVSEDAEDSPDGAEKGMLGLEWTLDFSRFGGRGSMGRLKLKVRNQRDWADAGNEEVQDARAWQRVVRQYQNDGRYSSEDET